MSTFQVPVKQVLSVKPHPNADLLDLAQIDGFGVVVSKGQLSKGDLVAYIPENAVVPENLLKTLNLWDSDKGK